MDGKVSEAEAGFVNACADSLSAYCDHAGILHVEGGEPLVGVPHTAGALAHEAVGLPAKGHPGNGVGNLTALGQENSNLVSHPYLTRFASIRQSFYYVTLPCFALAAWAEMGYN